MTYTPARKSFRFILLFIGLWMTTLYSRAQDDLNLSMTTEYDIGFDCPAGAALSPDETVIWVLMDGCYDGGFNLRGFNIADGTPINDETNDYADVLLPLENNYVDHFTNPVAFTLDGDLSIRYSDSETYDTRTLLLSLETGEAEVLTNDSLNEFIRTFTEYPEATIYSNDHTLGIAVGDTSLHVIDLQAETELLMIENENYTKFGTFSADSQRLLVAELNNPDDYTDNSAILHIYSLPDGELLASIPVPSFMLIASPDGRYVAAKVDDSELAIVDLETGVASPALRYSEEPRKVMECVNNGNDLSDVDFKTSGRLAITGLVWLPDSSGFMTVHSYGGEGAGGGALCFFDYSRLREYTVEN